MSRGRAPEKPTVGKKQPPAAVAPATFPCAVCGGEFVPGRLNRCAACGAFCCRDCLKISYHKLSETDFLPTRVLCYHCHHAGKTDNL